MPGSQETKPNDLYEDVEMSGISYAAKRTALNDFVKEYGLIKKQMKTNWHKGSDISRIDYLVKTRIILKEVANVLAPVQDQNLLNVLFNSKPEMETKAKMIENISTAYNLHNLCTEWGTQRQILSLFLNVYNFNEL